MKAVQVSMSGLDLQLAAGPEPAQATDQIVQIQIQVYIQSEDVL